MGQDVTNVTYVTICDQMWQGVNYVTNVTRSDQFDQWDQMWPMWPGVTYVTRCDLDLCFWQKKLQVAIGLLGHFPLVVIGSGVYSYL